MNPQSSSRGHHGRDYSRGIPVSKTFSNEHDYNHSAAPPYINQSQQYSHRSYHNPQRVNSNRSNKNRDCVDNNNKQVMSNSYSSDNLESRPRLQLLPRSQKLPCTNEENSAIESSSRNTSIFGCGKPRNEHDPKLIELNKHIDEVIDIEQNLSHTASTTSHESKNDIIK